MQEEIAKINQLTQTQVTNMEKENTKFRSIRQGFALRMDQMKKETIDLLKTIETTQAQALTRRNNQPGGNKGVEQ